MAFHVRDAETDRVVRELAAREGTSLTETIRRACHEALKRAEFDLSKDDRRSKAKAIRERLARLPRDRDVVIDKAFFDALYDE